MAWLNSSKYSLLLCFSSSWYETYSSLLSVDSIKADIWAIVGQKQWQPFCFFDGLCQLLSHEQSKTVTVLSLLPLNQTWMIAPSIGEIQDSHGILSRFPFKEEEKRAFSFKVVLSLWLSTQWKAWQLRPTETLSGRAVSSAGCDRQAGWLCFSAILSLITRSDINLLPFLFINIFLFYMSDWKLEILIPTTEKNYKTPCVPQWIQL